MVAKPSEYAGKEANRTLITLSLWQTATSHRWLGAMSVLDFTLDEVQG
jgi:hypothetical protein